MYSIVVFAVICVFVVGGNILDRLKDRSLGDEVNIGYAVENKDIRQVSAVGKTTEDENLDEYEEEAENPTSRTGSEIVGMKNNIESVRPKRTRKTRNSKNMQYFSTDSVGNHGRKVTDSQSLVTLTVGDKVKKSKRYMGQRLVEFKTHDAHETKHKSSHNHRLLEYHLEEPQSLENHERTLKNESLTSKKETLSQIKMYSTLKGFKNESVTPSLPLYESRERKYENFKTIRVPKSGEKSFLSFKAEALPSTLRLKSVIRDDSGWKEAYNKDEFGNDQKISIELSDQPRLECTIAPEEDNSVIRAALLLPNNTDYISALPKVLPVLMLAQAEVHRRQLLPRNLSFLFLPRDDRCDAVYAQLGTFEAARQNVHVFFGPACEYSVGKLEFTTADVSLRLFVSGTDVYKNKESNYSLLSMLVKQMCRLPLFTKMVQFIVCIKVNHIKYTRFVHYIIH